ncbi:MAG: hypothetical protein WA906_05000 [Pacificimonas sp.]
MKRLGPVDSLSYALARGTTFLPGVEWHRYRLLAVPRAGMPKMPRGYQVDVEAGDALSGLIDADRQTIEYRAEHGLHALVARRGDAVVGVNWLGTESFEEDEVPATWRVPPNGCWDTGLWIDPARRLSRAFQALWAGTAAWMASRDLEWSFSRISDYNLGSLLPHFRMDGRELGTISFASIGGLTLATSGTPRLAKTGRITVPLAAPK